MELLPPPGPQRTRQLVLLAVLAVVVAALAWSQWGGSPAGIPGTTSNTQVPPAGGPLGPLPEALRLASLDEEAGPLGSTRNPFRFGQPPAPPRAEIPPPPMPPPPPPVPVDTGPPPIPLELVALWNLPDGRRVASLRNPQTKTTFLAAEGEIVDGRYKLVAIQERSVIVTYLDGSGRRTIPLSGRWP